MPRFPRNVSTAFIAQTVPRARARGDRQALALGDAGHGGAPETGNPLLYGLGGTLEFQLNAFVRTWSVFVEATFPNTNNTVREEITSFFSSDPDIPRRYRTSGALGVKPFGLDVVDRLDYANGLAITFILEMRNVALTTTVRREMIIRDGVLLDTCPTAEDCDFALFGPINKAGVRIFQNMVDRDAVENSPVSFHFDVLDKLIARVPDLETRVPNYSEFGTVGIEFHNDAGVCGPVSEGGIPAGCGSIDCCCEIHGTNISATYTNISTGSTPVIPGTTVITQFDEIEVQLTIPTSGGVNCLGFDDLRITLPGLDSTGGLWNLYDPLQAGGFTPVVTVGGSPVSPTFSQDGQSGFTGTGNSVEIIFGSIPVACGEEIVVTYRMYPVTTSTPAVSEAGDVTFDTGQGPCSGGSNSTFHHPGIEVGGGGGVKPPPGEPTTWDDSSTWVDSSTWEDTTP